MFCALVSTGKSFELHAEFLDKQVLSFPVFIITSVLNNFFLVTCDLTTWFGSYEDINRVKMFITRQFGTYFRGAKLISGADNPPINGTLENDCSGSINFELLGGVQPFQYFPDNCSIVMSATGNVFRSKLAECLGKVFFIYS